MRSLADGKIKFTILTTAPADPAAPTVTELEAGIDASDSVLTSDFNWTNADSATFEEKSLRQKGQALALGTSNYTLGATFFREFLAAGGPDVAGEDAAYQAVKAKGTNVWCYARETDKDSAEAWAAGDEIYLGGEVATDTPQRLGPDGTIKRRVPLVPVDMYEDIAAATAGV